MTSPPPATRRDELLGLAATMFAERGLRATTVRDIADAAGIPPAASITISPPRRRRWSTRCCAASSTGSSPATREIIDTEPDPMERLKGLFMASLRRDRAPPRRGRHLSGRSQATSSQPRFSYVSELNRRQRKMWVDVPEAGHQAGLLPPRHRRRPRLPVHPRHDVGIRALVHPGGPLTAEQVGRQYLSILGGIAAAKK